MRSIRKVVRGIVALVAASVTASFVTSAYAGEGPFQPIPLQVGVEAYRSGEPLRAMAVFVNLAQANRQSAQPAIWAGVAATAAGRMDDAGVYLREGLRRPHTEFQERVIQAWLQRLKVFREAEAAAALPAAANTPKAIAALAHAANPRLSWTQASWIGDHIVAAARREGLDPWLLAAVVYIESRFSNAARSWAGALGLGQLMPQTARAAGVNPRDPWENLLGAAITLRGCYLTFRDWSLALAAYNAGERAVRRYGGIPPYAETRWYVSAVWAIYRQFRPAG